MHFLMIFLIAGPGLSEIQMGRGESGTDNGLSSDQQKVGKRYVDVTPPLWGMVKFWLMLLTVFETVFQTFKGEIPV